MPIVSGSQVRQLTLLLAALIVFGCAAPPPRDETGSPSPVREMADRREQQTMLSGTVEATEAVELMVPDLGVSPVQVRFLIEDGADILEGEVVAEFDNSSIVSNLEQLERTAVEAETSWLSMRARVTTELEAARFELITKQAEHDKAVACSSDSAEHALRSRVRAATAGPRQGGSRARSSSAHARGAKGSGPSCGGGRKGCSR